MKSAKHPVATCFFAYVFTRKRSANQQKKIQGCDFLLNRRPHAKIQLIWTEKKNRPKFDIEWIIYAPPTSSINAPPDVNNFDTETCFARDQTKHVLA